MMYSRRDPVIHPTPITQLRPTQMTVGMREVEVKRKAWRARDSEGKSQALARHMVPVVIGPGRALYVTDHHHLARALWEDGQKEVFVVVAGDLSKAAPAAFWNLMDFHGWTHPYDDKGRRRGYEDLPKSIAGLEDDPYRALAGALRRMGGFAKDSTPFSEFVWADFFRPRFKRRALAEDFDGRLGEAFEMAKSTDADFLPGWCGPHDAVAKTTAEPARRRKAKP